MTKPGYKHTELGWIPEEWEVKKMKSIVDINSTSLSEKNDSEYSFYYIDLSAVSEGRISLPSSRILFKDAPSRARRKIFKDNILMSTVRPNLRGFALFHLSESDYVVSTGFAVLSTKPNSYSNFVYQLLFSKTIFDQINNLVVGSNYPAINTSDVENLTIPLPPLPEQKKIAEILSTWDRAIETTEKLIEAKNKLKKGLMQQLLTGKKRFKEFEGKWGNTKIKNIANQVIARNTSNENYHVLSCTKYSGLVDSLKYFGKQIFSNDLSTYKVVKRNQFAYATNHIEEGSIGLQNVFDNALISPMYTVFETNNEIDNDFLFAVLKTEEYRKVFESNTSGSINRRGGLRWNDFSNIQIPKPSVEEQSRISGFLSIINQEISLLTARLASLQQQKKGLMQVLLTGKVRVKI